MRISAEAKEKTRERLLKAGRRLFSDRGFDETTTRDIARQAGVAAGTLFNYFPSKESLATTILAEALEAGREEFLRRRERIPSLEEELFAYVAAELRALGPYRGFVGTVLEAAMSPFGRSPVSGEAEAARQLHLETVAEAIHRRCGPDGATSVSLHLYWSLYLGVLSYWSADPSANQADSLVLLDQATRLFASSLMKDSTGGDL